MMGDNTLVITIKLLVIMWIIMTGDFYISNNNVDNNTLVELINYNNVFNYYYEYFGSSLHHVNDFDVN